MNCILSCNYNHFFLSNNEETLPNMSLIGVVGKHLNSQLLWALRFSNLEKGVAVCVCKLVMFLFFIRVVNLSSPLYIGPGPHIGGGQKTL